MNALLARFLTLPAEEIVPGGEKHFPVLVIPSGVRFSDVSDAIFLI